MTEKLYIAITLALGALCGHQNPLPDPEPGKDTVTVETQKTGHAQRFGETKFDQGEP